MTGLSMLFTDLRPPTRRLVGAPRRRSSLRAPARFRPLRSETLEARTLLAALPFGVHANDDTGDYMLGDVLVTVVFMESTGQVDPSTENWTDAHRNEVKANIEEGLRWWEDQLALRTDKHYLTFHIDYTYADNPVPTAYEPIARRSNDYVLWVEEFVNYVGFNTPGNLGQDLKAFNHAQRVAHETHWAFTIFVANAANDADGRFAAGGSFSRAFAFAGGRFFVMPSTRPASTVAHETGHMFYAYDEYPGSAHYNQHRGYYWTQNTNAFDGNPNPASRVPSIMAIHEEAYPIGALSPAAAEMIGWKDSDGDGVFDVLDVPHELTGAGWRQADGTYRFVGSTRVGRLPNLNTFDQSLQNDSTIGLVDRTQYRIDGGAWITIAEHHAYEAALDLTIPVPAGAQTIELRTVDDRTGVTSAVFSASLATPAATALPGVTGFVFHDENGDGAWQPGEPLLVGWSVDLLNSVGQPVAPPRTLLADDYEQHTQVNQILPGVTLTAVGFGVWESTVRSRQRDGAPAGDHVFKHFIGSGWSSSWTYGNGIIAQQRQLRIDFEQPVAKVSIDAIANSNNDYGRLDAYNAAGQLVARYTTGQLSNNQVETMTVARPNADIAYVLASGHANTGLDLDNLVVGPANAATTAGDGFFQFGHLDPGQYRVRLTPPPGWTGTTALEIPVTLAAGQSLGGLAFGVDTLGPVWTNPVNPYDVDGSGFISLNDVVVIVQQLRIRGIGPLTGSPSGPNMYVDVNGDGLLTIGDALAVINVLRSQQSAGEAEPSDGVTGPTGGGGSGASEGEFVLPWSTPPRDVDGDTLAVASDDDDHHHRADDEEDRRSHFDSALLLVADDVARAARARWTLPTDGAGDESAADDLLAGSALY